MVTPVVKRQAVAHLCESYKVSQRRACHVIAADRTSMRYRSIRPDDAVLRARLRELAAQRRRFGYRRLLILLRREGIHVNHKKLRRLYREERLQVRRRRGRKRALGTRAPIAIPQGANQRWSLDFLSDQLSNSRQFRILAVVDDFTRECLALVADTSLSGMRVSRELDAIIKQRGRWQAATHARVHRTTIALPIRGSVRSAWQGQRQGQGRRAGRLCAPELPRANPGF
jgi:putative transposase